MNQFLASMLFQKGDINHEFISMNSNPIWTHSIKQTWPKPSDQHPFPSSVSIEKDNKTLLKRQPFRCFCVAQSNPVCTVFGTCNQLLSVGARNCRVGHTASELELLDFGRV